MKAFKKSLAIAIGCAFTQAATPQPAPENKIYPDKPTLWKTETFDMILSLQQCKESGVCGEVVWLNPKDKSIYEYFTSIKDRADRRLNSGDLNEVVTEADVMKFCGYKPKMNFQQVAANRWIGSMDVPGLGMTLKTEVEIISDQEIKVKNSKGFISSTDTWRRIADNDPRYPRCTVKPAVKK